MGAKRLTDSLRVSSTSPIRCVSVDGGSVQPPCQNMYRVCGMGLFNCKSIMYKFVKNS